MYLIKRLDQGGGYVTPSGSRKSYTKDPTKARVFENRQDAERELCPENETIVSVASLSYGYAT